MHVQENIQPLLRFFAANITADTDTSVVSIADAHAVRVVAHVGTVSGSNVIRVFVNTTNSTNGATELTAKATPTLASDNSYEIFVTGEEAITALPGAAYLFVRVDVGGSSPSVPIAIDVSAYPARRVPATLPTGWTRII